MSLWGSLALAVVAAPHPSHPASKLRSESASSHPSHPAPRLRSESANSSGSPPQPPTLPPQSPPLPKSMSFVVSTVENLVSSLAKLVPAVLSDLLGMAARPVVLLGQAGIAADTAASFASGSILA